VQYKYSLYLRIVDDVMFALNLPGIDDANRAYAQSDSPWSSTDRAESDILDFPAKIDINFTYPISVCDILSG